MSYQQLPGIEFAHRIYPTAFRLRADDLHYVQTDYKTAIDDTHSGNVHAKNLHWVIENIMLLPFKFCSMSFALIGTPYPGKDKDAAKWKQNVTRVIACAAFVLSLAPAIASLLISLGLRMISHPYRPAFRYYVVRGATEPPPPALSVNRPLHAWSVNLSLTPSTWVNRSNDMRDPMERTREIIDCIMNEKNDAPEMIFVQEGWNEDCVRELVTSLTNWGDGYKYVVHDVAPGFFGMGSGCLVLSKYPIKTVTFDRFRDMTWQHRLPPRGILGVVIGTAAGPLKISNVHLQSLSGEARRQVRIKQIDQIEAVVNAEHDVEHLIVGDFNTDRVDEEGNIDVEEGHVETHLLNKFKDTHDNQRPPQHQPWVEKDNQKMGTIGLPAPTGVWVKGCCLQEDYPRNVYGTMCWFDTQNMDTCRLDRAVHLPLSNVTATSEIRRWAHGKTGDHAPHSPPSDHGILDLRIYTKEDPLLTGDMGTAFRADKGIGDRTRVVPRNRTASTAGAPPPSAALRSAPNGSSKTDRRPGGTDVKVPLPGLGDRKQRRRTGADPFADD